MVLDLGPGKIYHVGGGGTVTVTREVVLKLLAFVGLGIAQSVMYPGGTEGLLAVLICASSEELLRALPITGSWHLRRRSAIGVGLVWGALEGLVAGNWIVALINGSCHAGYGLTYVLLSRVHPIIGLMAAIGLHTTFNLSYPTRPWINLLMIVLLIVSRKWKEGTAEAVPSSEITLGDPTTAQPEPSIHPSASSCSEA